MKEVGQFVCVVFTEPELGHMLHARSFLGFSVMNMLEWCVATPIQFIVGKRFYVGAWAAIQHRRPDMSVLVVIGTTTAYAFSCFSMAYGSLHDEYTRK